MSDATEFRSGEAVHYDTRSTGRWIFSHLKRYLWMPILAIAFSIANNC